MQRATLLLLVLAATGSSAAEQALGGPWRSLAPGVAVASAADLGADPSWAARVLLVDPARVRFAVRFDPETPPVETWQKRYPEAIAVSVGSFFSADRTIRPTCDLIADGKPQKGAGCHRQDALYFGARPLPRKAVPLALPAKLKRPAGQGLPPAPPRPSEPGPRLVSVLAR